MNATEQAALQQAAAQFGKAADRIDVLAGDGAWFVCRAAGITDDVTLRLNAATTTEQEIAKQGRMRAARMFKRRHGLHPCTRVDVEYQGVERAALARVGGAP